MNFKINFLDHVAIHVKDMEKSADWYTHVLGLERIQPEEWKPFPIMLFSNGSGVAIFPAKTENPMPLPTGDWLAVSHFAFNVSREGLEQAKVHFQALNLDFKFQDHIYYHSIYITDPDGYQVELTAQVRDL